MPSRASPWEHHPAVPEDTPPSEESTALRTLFLPRTRLLPRVSPPRDQFFPSRTRQSQQPTSLISAYTHGVIYATRSSHVSNVATTPIQCFKYQISVIYWSAKLYIGYRIPDDISRYDTKYRTSNHTSYQTKNIHVIAYINHMKLFKASLRS